MSGLVTTTKSLIVGDEEIVGVALGGHWSCVVLRNRSIAFDCGTLFDAAVSCEHVLISHGHADHVAALPLHTRIRHMNHMRVPSYVMPRVYHSAYRRFFHSLCALDLGGDDSASPDVAEEMAKSERTYKLIPAEYDAGAEPISLGKNRVLRCLQTVHRVESVAYVVLEQKRSLKAHMRDKSSDEIRAAALRGEEVSESVLAPLVAYTGDTTIEGVIQHQTLLDVPVLIMECTIWDESLAPALTAERGHIHLHHLNDHADRFNNKHVVLTHCSPRHNPAMVADALEQSRFAAVLRAKGSLVYIL